MTQPTNSKIRRRGLGTSTPRSQHPRTTNHTPHTIAKLVPCSLELFAGALIASPRRSVRHRRRRRAPPRLATTQPPTNPTTHSPIHAWLPPALPSATREGARGFDAERSQGIEGVIPTAGPAAPLVARAPRRRHEGYPLAYPARHSTNVGQIAGVCAVAGGDNTAGVVVIAAASQLPPLA